MGPKGPPDTKLLAPFSMVGYKSPEKSFVNFRKIPRNVIMYFGILPFDSKSEIRCVLHESS